VLRPASRVLVLDETGRVLLFHIQGDFIRGNGRRFKALWLPPGGGQEAGETPQETALRELWEETGLTGVEVGPCIWTRNLILAWGGEVWDSRESFFVCRAPAFEVDKTNWTELERRELGEHRWWSLDQIEASDELFVPSQLAVLLRPILGGEVPDVPLEIGL
jgi:8-oxo-dGTP pyrophosphatase MutT (NUDIX family)